MTTTAEAAHSREPIGPEEDLDDVIVLPEAIQQAHTAPTSPVETLIQEFAGVIEPQVVERAAAAARHALERSRLPATPDAVERLARDQLRVRLTPSGRIRRRHD